MSSGSLWDDLSSLVEILLRLGLRLAGFAICCAFAYQAYQALRSAFLGINTGGSAPVANPQSASSRFGAVAWGGHVIDNFHEGILGLFGFDVPAIVLWPWSH